MAINKWEIFSHDADMGIRGIGESIEKAFEMAAMALTGVVTDPSLVPGHLVYDLEIEEESLDYLFYEWINHLIFEMDTKKALFSFFDVQIKNNKLKAIIKGEKVSHIQGDFAVEIKGATFTELKVCKENRTWIAQCVIDI